MGKAEGIILVREVYWAIYYLLSFFNFLMALTCAIPGYLMNLSATAAMEIQKKIEEYER